MNYHFDLYDNGLVHLVINLPDKTYCVERRNDTWFDIWHSLHDKEVFHKELHVADVDYIKAVEHSIAFDMQDKDQYHVIFVPLAIFEMPHRTICKEDSNGKG